MEDGVGVNRMLDSCARIQNTSIGSLSYTHIAFVIHLPTPPPLRAANTIPISIVHVRYASAFAIGDIGCHTLACIICLDCVYFVRLPDR